MAQVTFIFRDAAGNYGKRHVKLSPVAGTIVDSPEIIIGNIEGDTDKDGELVLTLAGGQYLVSATGATELFAITVPDDSGAYNAADLVSSEIQVMATATARLTNGALQILFPDGSWRTVSGVIIGDQKTLDVSQN